MNPAPRTPSPAAVEVAVAAHLVVFLVGVSWAFGGNADWVRTPVSLWGSVGILMTLGLVAGALRTPLAPVAARWALPVVLLNLAVAASCLTPGFRYFRIGGVDYMMPVRLDWWIPSTAGTGNTLRALWLFDGIYFSCLNLALVASRRGTIRVVLAAAAGNALALAIFGTVQKLAGATGIFFGAVKTPHPQFFASFVYDNHWGAFALLMAGAAIGLALRYSRGRRGAGFFHGPAPSILVAVVLLGISVPLSGSRACTLLLGVLVVVAFVRGVPRVSRALRVTGLGTGGSIAVLALASALSVAAAWAVAGDVIQARALKTREQVTQILAQGGLGSRSTLYHDAWRMARQRPLFGWGMGTFPSVFPLFNSQESKIDRLPVIYHDAHSDWLQSVAEVGFAGTALIGAAVALPAFAVRRSRLGPIPYFLLLGCLLTAAYAWIEFPFGNVAVVLAWWLCFFCAVQYMRLAGPEPDAATGA